MFRINPWDCTECVGFADAPQCAAVCPADAIVLTYPVLAGALEQCIQGGK